MKRICKMCKEEYEIEEWESKTWSNDSCSMKCADIYAVMFYRFIGISKKEKEILLSKDKAYWQEEYRKSNIEAKKELEIILSNTTKLHRDVFNCFLDKEPDVKLVYKALIPGAGGDEDFIALQDFVGINKKSNISWSTNIGIIEAVISIVECAKENNNI